jgi:hypothetical protein
MSTNYKAIKKNRQEVITKLAADIQEAVSHGIDRDTKDNVRTLTEQINRVMGGMHIGLNSGGWVFGFRAYPEYNIRSWKEWKEFILDNDLIIMDEYGVIHPLDYFEQIVESSKTWNHKPAKSHHDIYGFKLSSNRIPTSWRDDDGYDFGDYEFS